MGNISIISTVFSILLLVIGLATLFLKNCCSKNDFSKFLEKYFLKKSQNWLFINMISILLFLVIGLLLQRNYVKYYESVKIRTLDYSKSVALAYGGFIVIFGIISWESFIFVWDWWHGNGYEINLKMR